MVTRGAGADAPIGGVAAGALACRGLPVDTSLASPSAGEGAGRYRPYSQVSPAAIAFTSTPAGVNAEMSLVSSGHVP